MDTPPPDRFDALKGIWYRMAANGWVPARWYLPNLVEAAPKAGSGGHLKLEIVSHCWRYAPFLIQQLNSLVRFAPKIIDVTVTVYHAESDMETRQALAAYKGREPDNVHWNWRALPERALFRRAIGRNDAAKKTQADWIWFTDCDVLFRENCLDALGEALKGRTDHLVYPGREWLTPLLPPDHPMICVDGVKPFGADIDPALFEEVKRTRATGPLQIMNGDTARAHGYCDCLPYYQKPVSKWAKAYEDRAVRWLLRTQGAPLDIPGVFRIRHQCKGRYHGSRRTVFRQFLRRLQTQQRWSDQPEDPRTARSVNPLKKIRQLAGEVGYRLRPKRAPSIAQHQYPPEFTLLKPGDVAIDAGANVGTVTAVLAATGATVHAFEPDEVAFEILRKNYAHLPHVHLHPQAVHDRNENVNLYRHLNHRIDPARFSQGSSLIAAKRNVDEDSGQLVEAIDLAAFIHGIKGSVKLLKMDIEGAEYHVLEHLMNTGAMTKVEKAFVETHARSIPSLKETDQRLRERIAREGLSEKIDLNWV